MKNLLNEIISSKQTCYFISPHYDDAVYSAGSLMSELSKTNKVIVINIFTKADNKSTYSAKQYLKQCEYDNSEKLYLERKKEDKRALIPIATQVIDLDFTEALWRKRKSKILNSLGNLLPELASIYPTYRFHIVKGRISRADREVISAIKKQLKNYINDPNFVVFCPLGVGNHIDHVVARLVCDELFKQAVHWVDYPYSLKNSDPTKYGSMTSFEFKGNQNIKIDLIKKYKTQYRPIFGNRLVLQPERYYYDR